MRNYRSTVVGFAILIVLLSAGAAQSLSGSNTVFSDDIVDGTVRHADIKANSLGGSRLLDNSITGAKIRKNTVTGDDVNEASLNMAGNCSAGQVKGNVLVQGGDGGSGIPSDPNSEAWGAYKYNCAAGRVFIQRYGAGQYRVTFERNRNRGAVATPAFGSTAVSAKVDNFGDGVFDIITSDKNGEPVDSNVFLLVW